MTTQERNALISDNWPLFVWGGRRIATVCPGYEADDATQDLASAAIRMFGRYDPARGRFTTWVAQLVRCVLARHREYVGAKKRIGKPLSLSRRNSPAAKLAAAMPDHRTPDPAEAAADREQHEVDRREVRRLLRRLSPKYRAAVAGRFGVGRRRIDPSVTRNRVNCRALEGLAKIRAGVAL